MQVFYHREYVYNNSMANETICKFVATVVTFTLKS